MKARTAALLLAVGCGTPPFAADSEPPRVGGVEPPCIQPGRDTDGVVTGRHLRRTYDAWQDQVKPLVIRAGNVELRVRDLDPEGTRAEVTFPAQLPAGIHDVTAENDLGSHTLNGALQVDTGCP